VRDRESVQNAEWFTSHRQLVGSRGVGQRALGNQRDDGIDLGIDAVDPREMR
jgi:hypothetical protein